MNSKNVNSEEEVLAVNEDVTVNENNAAHAASKAGTWISLGIVGVVILATYFVLYGLYMTRL